MNETISLGLVQVSCEVFYKRINQYKKNHCVKCLDIGDGVLYYEQDDLFMFVIGKAILKNLKQPQFYLTYIEQACSCSRE